MMSVQRRVFLGLVRIADELTRRMGEALEPYRLTLSQYGVLEALRDAGENGLACGEIAGRMITREPDVTRLLDRLENRGLVSRHRGRPDRRMVLTQLTPAGVALLATIDGPMRALHADRLRGMARRDLGALDALLELTAAAVHGPSPGRARTTT
jgi:DNA-binding MarR family transcriptional regulator